MIGDLRLDSWVLTLAKWGLYLLGPTVALVAVIEEFIWPVT